jgi:integrase
MRDMLTTRRIETIKQPGRYADGGGLWLQVSEWKTKAWIFQYSSPTAPKVRKPDGREIARVRHLGLGPYGKHDVTLARARELAARAREQVRAGIDPVDARKADRETKRLADAKRLSFKQCADKYIGAHEASWASPKHREQWKSTLAAYVYPTIGALPVQAIDTALVTRVLEPIWSDRTETAIRVRGRIEAVLDWAKARGYRSGENPARWKGHLQNLLPNPGKIKKVRHHPALPYAELPGFMLELRSRDGISARALEFCILTACRSGEVTHATWDEIDLADKTWTIRAERMKARKEHRVPLSERALEILQSLPREPNNPHVFIGNKPGAPLSAMAMLEMLRGLRPQFSVHGFRSTFCDWAAERTNFQTEVAELALAHKLGDKVEAAYRRGDMFEKRRRLAGEWAKYCAQVPVAADRAVIPMRAVERTS